MELSTAEVTALNAARDVLEAIGSRARAGALTAGVGRVIGYNLGRTGEAAHVADKAIFDTLNCVTAFGFASLSNAQLHNTAA